MGMRLGTVLLCGSSVAAACLLTFPLRAPRVVCCADSAVARNVAVSTDFERQCKAILDDAQVNGLKAALDARIDELDQTFIPELGVAVSENLPVGNLERERLSELMAELETRTQDRFERGRAQLETLLESGEITKLDANLVKLVKRKEVDAGFFYVIMRNMEDAQEAGDDTRIRMLTHIHTRVQEELEKQSEPGVALLHKVTRTEGSDLRDRVLRHFLAPKTTVLLPDGTEIPSQKPQPALVQPSELADAIVSSLEKIVAMPLAQEAIEATAEDIRQVAKEAHRVIADSYSSQQLEEFQDALTPAFAMALPSRCAPAEQ